MNTIVQKSALNFSPTFFRCCATLLLLLFVAAHGYAQLSVNVTPTHATCTANGSLSFSAQNAAPGITVIYTIYKIPDTSTPVYSGPNTSVGNLPAASYEVVASQGSNTSTPVLVAIQTPNVPLDFTITAVAGLCDNTSSLTVNVTSGTAVGYELLSGPVTRPLQASPQFNTIDSGVYEIAVTDVCGNIKKKNSLVPSATHFTTSHASYPKPMLPSCDGITAVHTLTANGLTPLPYPLTLTYAITPPDGSGDAPFTITKHVATGPPTQLLIEQEIPVYDEGATSYEFTAHYGCGSGWPIPPPSTDAASKPHFMIEATAEDAACGETYLKVIIRNGVPPFNVSFGEDVPEGFIPADMNPNYGNPFYTNEIDFGNFNLPAPVGFYNIIVSDACGNYMEKLLVLTPYTKPEAQTFNNDCVNQHGWVRITLPLQTLATAKIVEAPDDYAQTTPYVVTHLIENEVLVVDDMPIGHYTFVLTDTCGLEYTERIEILPFISSLITGETKADCTADRGTLHISAQNPPLSIVKIMEAPDDFPYETPYDVSFNINPDGSFYMDNLPLGQYYIRGYDACSAELGRPLNIAVKAVEYIENVAVTTPHCGFFDVEVFYDASDNDYVTFWLQKEISPGVWGHPATGTAYPEDTAPTAANAFALTPYTPVNGLTWTGNFRVIKHFETFGSGTVKLKHCINVLNEFSYGDELEVTDIRVISCPGPTANVRIETNGVPPVTFKIIRKNGSPYTVYNFENPVFTNLEPAIYSFEVRDACGGLVVQDFDVQGLPPVVVANNPGNLFACDAGNDGTELFDLSQQNAGILGTQDPDEYTIQYFESQEKADLDWMPLPLNYTSGPATIYARIVNKNATDCYATTSFQLALYNTPVLQMADRYAFCENDDITVTADAGFAMYEWSTSPPVYTQSITTSTPGTYTVKVTDTNGCTTQKTIEIVASPSPHISHIDKTDWTNDSNTITVYVEPSPVPQEFEYSMDGVNYQQSNTFTNLAPGKHFVFVRDVFHCGVDYEEVYLLAPPPFFSPNGDGVNDTWRVPYAITEPDMYVYIFDRYGRMIVSFDANDKGWDGNFNGVALPASDYWYVIRRGNGQEYRGHFSLMR